VWYVYASWQNPKAKEIVVGSVLITWLLTSLLASSSTLLANVPQEPNARKASVARRWITSASLLAVVIAFLVYSSNTPRELKRQIPITYLIDMNDLEIPWNLEIASSEARFAYRDAVDLFHNFKHANSGSEKLIGTALGDPGASGFSPGVSLFRDLTEILIPRCIGGITEQGDMESAFWRGEDLRWEARPDKSIAGTTIDFNDIEGLNQNQFFHILGSPMHKFHKIELRLPKGTRVRLLRAGTPWSSTYVISNNFVEIKIRVQVFVIGQWLRHAFPAESAFRAVVIPGAKRRGPFCCVDTVIYYDVEFHKAWYSLPAMRHHENWVDDLFALLSRRLAWGQPPINDMRQSRNP